MNKSILNTIVDARGGHYVHAIEVSEVFELEAMAESITQEFEETHTEHEISEFLESLEVYCLDDDNDAQIFSFSFTDYLKQEAKQYFKLGYVREGLNWVQRWISCEYDPTKRPVTLYDDNFEPYGIGLY